MELSSKRRRAPTILFGANKIVNKKRQCGLWNGENNANGTMQSAIASRH